MKVMHQLRMDLARCGCRPVVGAVQGEANARVLEVSLYDSGVAWEIPEAAVVDVAYQKPDGTKGIYSKLPDGTEATTFSNNVLSATLAPQMLTCAGTIRAAFVFHNEGQATLATFPFTITVEANPAAGAERSEDYYNPTISDIEAEIRAVMVEIQGIGDAVGAAEAAAASAAESARTAAADAADAAADAAQKVVNSLTPEQIGARPDTWTPTASEVGARPDTWTPTASEVGARPNTWTPTASEVGARPDTWLPSIGEIGAAPAVEDANYPGCYYRTVDGVKEWVNPPMIPGVEYRTTERYNGKPVYVKLIDVGDMPSNDTKTIYHEISVDRPLNIILTAEDAVLNWHPWFDQIRLEKTTLYIVTNNASASAYTGAQCRLKYTKD